MKRKLVVIFPVFFKPLENRFQHSLYGFREVETNIAVSERA